MTEDLANAETLVDFVTGRRVPNVGAEANRQAVERLLVEEKGFDRREVEVDVPISLTVDGTAYRSRVDLVLRVDGRRVAAVKCAAGSIGSREREILAAARLLEDAPLPLAVVSDGRTAVVIDTRTGRPRGAGLAAVPDREAALKEARRPPLPPLDEKRLRREKLIFRSYDGMMVNVAERADRAGG